MNEERIRELFQIYSQKIENNQNKEKFQLGQSLSYMHKHFLDQLTELKLYPAKELLDEWCSILNHLSKSKNRNEFSNELIAKSLSRASNLYHFFETREREMKKEIVLEPYKLFLNEKEKPYYLGNALLLFETNEDIETIMIRNDEIGWNYCIKEEKNKLSELIELSYSFVGEVFYVNFPKNYPLEETVKPLAINKYITAVEFN